jgi:hypothetical protein
MNYDIKDKESLTEKTIKHRFQPITTENGWKIRQAMTKAMETGKL